MRLLVLAGGFGTRLKTVVSDVPKSLAPIGEIPFLKLQIINWIQHGIREFIFLLHHQSDQIIDYLNSQKSSLLKGCRFECISEPIPLNTGGAIANAVKVLDFRGDFLITNSDTWLSGGFEEMIRSCEPSIATVELPDVSRYGQVEFNHNHMVTSFVEKNGNSQSGWINAGLCHFQSELFEKWNGQPFSLEKDLLQMLVKQKKLSVVPLKTNFIDIGIPDDYYRFCVWENSGRRKPL